MAQGDGRGEKAYALALSGELIDVAIDAWGWDPYTIMGMRKDQGWTWIPSALQPPVPLGPGINFPGLPAYDAAHPPAGTIKVSIDPADYPPYEKAPAPVPVNMNLVGILAYGNVYFPGPGAHADTVKDGQHVVQDGHEYVAHVVIGLMGWGCSFVKVN